MTGKLEMNPIMGVTLGNSVESLTWVVGTYLEAVTDRVTYRTVRESSDCVILQIDGKRTDENFASVEAACDAAFTDYVRRSSHEKNMVGSKAMTETAENKLNAAEKYALNLAKGLAEKHFPNNEWELLDCDLIGLLMQIDNMTRDLVNKTKLKIAFRRALADLPEIAPSEIKGLLSSVYMNDIFINEGKRLQRIHGFDAVAPRVEQECGAGAWSLMRNGVLAFKG